MIIHDMEYTSIISDWMASKPISTAIYKPRNIRIRVARRLNRAGAEAGAPGAAAGDLRRGRDHPDCPSRQMAVSYNWSTPKRCQKGWSLIWKIPLKSMMTGGTPYDIGNLNKVNMFLNVLTNTENGLNLWDVLVQIWGRHRFK